jgi:Tol biopolymer transport system component
MESEMKFIAVLLLLLALVACDDNLPYSAEGSASDSPDGGVGDLDSDVEPSRDVAPEGGVDAAPDLPSEVREFTAPIRVGQGGEPHLLGFSPDGRWLAWLDYSEDAGHPKLLVTETSTGRSRTLADRIVLRSILPALISPDSRFIAYRDGSALSRQGLAPLVVARLDGSSSPVRVSESLVEAQNYVWTRDTAHLVFNGTNGLELWRVPTGEITHVSDSASTFDRQPADVNLPISADGRYLAYVAGRDLYLWDFESGTSEFIAEDVGEYNGRDWGWGAPRFDSGGTRIAWVSGRDPVVRLTVRDIETEVQVASPAGAAPRLSTDWRHVAYLDGYDRHQDGGADLWTYDFVSDESTHIGAHVDPFHYKYSPDSEHLLYVSDRATFDSVGGRLHLWSRETGVARFLAETVSTQWSEMSSVVTGDRGSWVAYEFVSEGEPDRSELRNLDSGRTVEGSGGCLSMAEGNGLAGWGAPFWWVGNCALFLPTGDVIQYSAGIGRSQLTRTSLSSGETVELVGNTFRIPRLSPSHALLLAGRRLDEGRADVIVVELEEWTLHTLARDVPLGDLLIGDQHVAFTTRDDQDHAVWVSSLQ